MNGLITLIRMDLRFLKCLFSNLIVLLDIVLKNTVVSIVFFLCFIVIIVNCGYLW